MKVNWKKIRKKTDKRLAERRRIITLLNSEKEKLKQGQILLENIEKAQKAVQVVSQKIQNRVHTQLAKGVDTGLKSVFSFDYGFRIKFVKRRNKTEAELLVTYQNHEIVEPLDEDSGGVVDVAAFILRVSCIVLAKPHSRRFIILDEPFKFVSEEYRPAVRQLTEKLSDKFNFQIVMITHIKELMTGKVIRL